MADGDSNRAWQLLIARLEGIEAWLARLAAADDQFRRDYRADCQRLDKELAGLLADVGALTARLDALKRNGRGRTPVWQKALWAAGTMLGAAILARLSGVAGSDLGLLIRWLTASGP